MRFSEIADSKYQTLTDTDVAELFDEIDKLGPDPIGDDDLALIPNLTTKLKVMPVERHWLNRWQVRWHSSPR